MVVKLIKFLKNYLDFIYIFLITIFLNVTYIYLYLPINFLSYLYYNDKYFNIYIFKLIIPFNSLGRLIGGFFIYSLFNLFGYIKTIQISIILIGITLILQSFTVSCISFCIYSFFNGILFSILFIFITNFCLSLYPEKILIFGSLISSGWLLSFFPINILNFYLVNIDNKKPEKLIFNSIKIFEEIDTKKEPYFLLIYGVLLIFLSFFLTLKWKNPIGIKNNFNKYIENFIIFKGDKENEINYFNKHSDILSSNNIYYHSIYSESYKSSINYNSYELNDKLSKNLLEENAFIEINNKIEKEIFFKNLFSKIFY